MDNLKMIKDYRKDNDDFYENIKNDMKEIRKSLNYVLTEQEKQRIESMTINELCNEILNNLHDMRNTIKKLGDK